MTSIGFAAAVYSVATLEKEFERIRRSGYAVDNEKISSAIGHQG